MSDHIHYPSGAGRKGSSVVAFILGAVVVALFVIGYSVYTGSMPVPDDPDIRIELPSGTAIEGEIDRSGG